MVERTITTTGRGQTVTPPETARVDVKALGRAETPREARDRATGRVSEIRSALESEEVAPDAIRTTGLRVEHRSELFETSEDDPAYRATVELAIECVPDTVKDIVVRVTDAGARLTSVSFQLLDSTRNSLRDEALEKAMHDARRDAETIAAVENLSVGAVQKVTTDATTTHENSIVEDAIEDLCLELQPESITVTAEVEIVYGID